MENYFQAKRDRPYHLSIGAVVLNENNKVLCHYFKKKAGFEDFYILKKLKALLSKDKASYYTPTISYKRVLI